MVSEEDYAAYALSNMGEPDQRVQFPERTLAWLDGRVPGSMIRFLVRIGLGSWRGGFFQVTDGRKYHGLLEAALQGDPDFGPEMTTVFAMSGFGELFCWHRRYGALKLRLFPNELICPDYFDESALPEELSALTPFAVLFGNVGDVLDLSGQPMFARLTKTHGPLPHDHVFAPRLHPALGGPQEVGNFRPASAPEAIALMHQAEPYVLVDSSSGQRRRIRAIGPQG